MAGVAAPYAALPILGDDCISSGARSVLSQQRIDLLPAVNLIAEADWLTHVDLSDLVHAFDNQLGVPGFASQFDRPSSSTGRR